MVGGATRERLDEFLENVQRHMPAGTSLKAA
jgi:hypothetical protein